MNAHKKLSVILIAILFFATIVSCQNGVGGTKLQEIYSESYVAGYTPLGGITLSSTDYSALRVIKQNMKGNHLIYSVWSDVEKDRITYREICTERGDIGYNRLIKYILPGDTQHYSYENLVSVDLVSDADYDDNHPAGESLGDIAVFMSATPLPYIQSGYKNVYNWSKNNLSKDFSYFILSGESPLHPIEKKVSELADDDLMLLGGGSSNYYNIIAEIRFATKPTLSQTHNFTLTMTSATGKTYTATAQMTFE